MTGGAYQRDRERVAQHPRGHHQPIHSEAAEHGAQTTQMILVRMAGQDGGKVSHAQL